MFVQLPLKMPASSGERRFRGRQFNGCHLNDDLETRLFVPIEEALAWLWGIVDILKLRFRKPGLTNYLPFESGFVFFVVEFRVVTLVDQIFLVYFCICASLWVVRDPVRFAFVTMCALVMFNRPSHIKLTLGPEPKVCEAPFDLHAGSQDTDPTAEALSPQAFRSCDKALDTWLGADC